MDIHNWIVSYFIQTHKESLINYDLKSLLLCLKANRGARFYQSEPLPGQNFNNDKQSKIILVTNFRP